jgi:Fur family ferric uptake transcriptional regulator
MDTADAVVTLAGYLERKGLKFTSQRRVITEAFFDPRVRDQHPSAEELYARVRQRDPRIGYATVYRTLKLLVDCNLASPRQFGDNQTRYEPEVPGEHHDHLVCLDCHAIIEFENEEIEHLQDGVAARLGFSVEHHRMVLYGRCQRGCVVPGDHAPVPVKAPPSFD